MRSCNESKTLHCVESYLYYIILVNKKKNSEEWNEGEKKIDNIIIYIVENIKFIYTSFDEFFLPVSQRVEMNYIFSDNVRILYLSCYFKSPKETVKLSKKSRNKRCSYRFWLCPLKSALISLYAYSSSVERPPSSDWLFCHFGCAHVKTTKFCLRNIYSEVKNGTGSLLTEASLESFKTRCPNTGIL